MPHNKDQHFNPQFYLRNFGAEENGRSIHLYNIARDKCIFSASIVGQCAHPYFYGKDGRVESGLAMLEDAAAPMFRRMITDRKLPPRHSAEHGLLGQFVAVQHGRTQARETQLNEMADKFGKHVLRKYAEPDLADYLDHVRISITNTATWNVHVAAVRAPILFDLEYKLLVVPPAHSTSPAIIPLYSLTNTLTELTSAVFVPFQRLRPSVPAALHHVAYKSQFRSHRSSASFSMTATSTRSGPWGGA